MTCRHAMEVKLLASLVQLLVLALAEANPQAERQAGILATILLVASAHVESDLKMPRIFLFIVDILRYRVDFGLHKVVIGPKVVGGVLDTGLRERDFPVQ